MTNTNQCNLIISTKLKIATDLRLNTSCNRHACFNTHRDVDTHTDTSKHVHMHVVCVSYRRGIYYTWLNSEKYSQFPTQTATEHSRVYTYSTVGLVQHACLSLNGAKQLQFVMSTLREYDPRFIPHIRSLVNIYASGMLGAL